MGTRIGSEPPDIIIPVISNEAEKRSAHSTEISIPPSTLTLDTENPIIAPVKSREISENRSVSEVGSAVLYAIRANIKDIIANVA